MFYEFKQKLENPYFPEIFDVNPTEVSENADKLVLIDVREDHEYAGELGHIRSSKLVPMGSIPEQLESLPRDRTIVFVCRSGGRSAKVSAYAKQQGFDQVYNMLGGMIKWNELSLPVEK